MKRGLAFLRSSLSKKHFNSVAHCYSAAHGVIRLSHLCLPFKPSVRDQPARA